MTIKRRRITLHNVAAEIGTSTSTVSRALNNHDSIDLETRIRVRQVADRLGYKAPRTDERRGANRVLSVILNLADEDPELRARPSRYGSFGHIQRMLFSIEQAAQARGYHLILNSTPVAPDELPPSVRTHFVDGVVVLGGLIADPLVESIAREVPTVFVSSYLPTGGVHAIHINYRLGTVLAMEHLVALGHRRIALLNGPSATNTSAEKLAGYLQACWQHDLPLDRMLVVDAPGFELHEGRRATAQLLEHARFTALVAGTDVLAHGAIEAAEARGVHIPSDLSVVSLYNSLEQLTQEKSVALTGVQVPFARIGEIAVDRLLALLAEPSPPRATVLYPELVIGDSSGPAPVP